MPRSEVNVARFLLWLRTIVFVTLGIGVILTPISFVTMHKTDVARQALFGDNWQDPRIQERINDTGLAIVGAGLAIGLGVGLRLGRRNGIAVGIATGTVVGMVALGVCGQLRFGGIGLIIPPVLGIAVGLVEGIGATPVYGVRRALKVCVGAGAAVGLGFAPAFAWAGFVGCVTMALFLATVAGARRDPNGGWRAGFHRPPLISVIILLVVFALVFRSIYGEHPKWMPGGGSTGFVMACALGLSVATFFVAPLLFYLAGRWLARWMQPRLGLLGQLADYLRVMWVPLGGFAIGYVTIIVIFAGLYGALYLLRPDTAFGGVPAGFESRSSDWLFFAFFTSMAQDYNSMVPASALARALVMVQLIASVAWAVVVFATVMTHVQPEMNRIAAAAAGEGGENEMPVTGSHRTPER